MITNPIAGWWQHLEINLCSGLEVSVVGMGALGGAGGAGLSGIFHAHPGGTLSVCLSGCFCLALRSLLARKSALFPVPAPEAADMHKKTPGPEFRQALCRSQLVLSRGDQQSSRGLPGGRDRCCPKLKGPQGPDQWPFLLLLLFFFPFPSPSS